MLPLKNDLVCVLESHIKCTDTAIFACRTPGTRQERRKKKEVKNPNPKRSVLRASLAPKISFLSQSHSLTPISSASSASLFFFFFSYCQIYPYIFYSFSLLPHLGMGDVNQCMAAASQVFNFFQRVAVFILILIRQKYKTHPLTFTFFHFSLLIFSFVNSIL